MQSPKVSIPGPKENNWPGQGSFLFALSALCAVLIFLGGPGYYAPRLYRAAWDLGHPVAFFVWTYSFVYTSPHLRRARFSQQVSIVMIATLLLGILIEWAQSIFHRTFSIRDVAGDAIGSLAALAFASDARRSLSKSALRAMQLAVLGLCVFQLYPFGRAVIDGLIARIQFPVLSSFETPFEMDRWGGTSDLAIDRNVARSGMASLKVTLHAGEYSTVSFRDFPSTWTGYRTVTLRLFNPSIQPRQLTCRISNVPNLWDDEMSEHVVDTEFTVMHGWNNVAIPLGGSPRPPTDQSLDLNKIEALGIYATDLVSTMVIYIDDIRLVR